MSKALDTSIAKARVAIGHFTSPKNSVSCNCQKISNQTRKPETILEIRKRPHSSKRFAALLFTNLYNILLQMKRRLTEQCILAAEFPPTFLNTWVTDEIFI